MVKIQVALDVIEPNRALQIAREAAYGGADWIEAGTGLIKSAGVSILRQLKEAFPDKTILADMKTMDAGYVEVEIAAKAGAGVVTILGNADNPVIEQALLAAKKYGVRIMVDLIAVAHPVERIAELEKMGVDLINIHVGIDRQMTGDSPIGLLQTLVSQTSMEIAVAGGLTPETAKEAASIGADIVIVGSYITNSDNVTQKTQEIRKAVSKPTAKSKGDDSKLSKDEEITAIFKKVSTCNISDAMYRKGAMAGISTKTPGKKIVGRATTVRTFGGDWAKPVEAIDMCGPGDIIVIYNGDRNIAMWGGLATLTASNKKLEGVVVDGAIRDFDEIQKMDFPVFAANIVPNAGDPKGLGEINAEIVCGNQPVNPGDYIIGDDSGVVVVPKERAYEIARRSEEVWKREKRLMDEINKGKTLAGALELLKWEKQR
ncbi:MAG: orotidine 5'-phosphate decarboxylase [Methanimicrococcus sp.]|nr:orotidine 5'-phosphate decarboxylase [Methanimicrococcus sp.]